MRRPKVIRIDVAFELISWTRTSGLNPRQGMMFRGPVSFRAVELRVMTDDSLVRRVDEADALALEVIFDRHGGAAFSLAYRTCGGQAIAKDYFAGFTHNQIADKLELPTGTVKGRMRLGLVKMRLSLGDLAGGGGCAADVAPPHRLPAPLRRRVIRSVRAESGRRQRLVTTRAPALASSATRGRRRGGAPTS